MVKISVKIKSARALLDWSQSDLAEKSNLDQATISSIEGNKRSPGTKTLKKITTALENGGIRFTDRGVELYNDSIQIFEGEEPYMELLQNVYEELRDKPGSELLIMYGTDSKSPPQVVNMYRQIRNAGITMRQLVEEGDTELMGAIAEYKYVPQQYFINRVLVIYGEKFAQIIEDPETKVIVIKDKDFVALQRNTFEWLWSLSETPKRSTANERF